MLGSLGSLRSLGSLFVAEPSFRRTLESSKTDDFFFPPNRHSGVRAECAFSHSTNQTNATN